MMAHPSLHKDINNQGSNKCIHLILFDDFNIDHKPQEQNVNNDNVLMMKLESPVKHIQHVKNSPKIMMYNSDMTN